MQTSVAKKLFAVGVAASTVLLGFAPFAASAAVHADGTNVSKSDGTVGMIIGGQFRPYTSAGAFLSYGFNSWGSVVAANADDLALPTGSFIAPQDGKIFCATATKASDVKGECSLISGGQKYAFTSAAVFTGLGFSFSRANYGDSSFLNKSANIDNSTSAHLAGVLVNNGGTVQLVGASGLMGIPDIATFNSWGYSFSDVVPANAADKTFTQTGVMASRMAGQLSPIATTNPGNGTTPVISGNVNASLSSDTPAAGSVIASQAIADLAHFNFTGTGTVTQVVLHRIGVSADTVLSNVYLYNGNTKLTDAGSVSNGTVTFSNANGLFTVNGSMNISVKSDIDGSAAAGQTVGMQLAGYTVANGTPATVTISGNVMNIAANAGLDTVTFSSVDDLPGANITAGTMSATLWSGHFTVSGSHTTNLKYIAFKQIGSIPSGAIQNLKLYINGNPVGNTVATLDSSNNVAFDMTNSPVALQSGALTVELRGDVVKGSSYTFNFRLQTASDIVLVDSNFGVNIGVTPLSSFPATPTTTTKVSSGSVSVQSDPTFTATQAVKNASNVTLGQWTMKAYGEDVKVQSLTATIDYFDSTSVATTTASDEGFNNLAIYVNGGMVGSSQTTVGQGTTEHTKTFGTTNLFTIPAGTTVTVAIKGDMVLHTGTGANATKVASVVAHLTSPANSIQGLTSYQTTTASPATSDGPTMSIVSSSAALAVNAAYGNQTVASNSTNQKIGSYLIQASNAEGVRVTSLTVGLGGSIANTNLANLYIQTPAGKTTPVNPQGSNNFSVDFTVAANQTAAIDVFADITNTTGTATTSMSGSGTGVGSQSAVNLASTPGQTITVSNGSLTGISFATSTSPVAQFVVGGKTTQAMGTWNVQSTSSPVTVTELGFTVGTTANGIVSVQVNGVSAPVVSGKVTLTGLNLVVPAGYAGLNIPVTVDFAPVGINGIASDQAATLALTHIKYLSGSKTTTNDTVNIPTPSMTLVSTKPSITVASSGSTLTGGTVKVARITVSADAAGDLKLENLPLNLTIGSGTSGTAVFSGNVSIKDTNGNTITTTGGAVSTASTSTVVSFGGYTVPANSSVSFDVYVTTTGTIGTGANMTLGLGTSSSLTWDDVNGNVPNIAGTYIANYPTDTVSIHN